MIEETIFSKLSTHAGLIALVGQRIYPLVLPQEATYPAVTFFVISDIPEHGMGGDPGIATLHLQVSSWDDNYFGAKRVDAQVKAALSRVMTVIEDALIDNASDDYDSTVDAYQVIRDFTIFYQ